jgi:hypothetical protein
MAKVTGSSKAKAMGGSKAGSSGKPAMGSKVQPAGKPFGTGGSYKGGHKDSAHNMKNC